MCAVYQQRFYGSPKNLAQLFAFLNPLSIKLVAVFDSMLKLELNDAQRIETYLSMFENFSYLANFYFNQYIVTNKSSSSLFNNAESFFKRSIVKVLRPLQDMKPGVEARFRILRVIEEMCSYQAQSLKTKEGIFLRSLLEEACRFIEITDLEKENTGFLKTFFSIKSLQQKSLEDNRKPASKKIPTTDESKETKFPTIQTISPREQKVNTSNESKSPPPDKITLNLDVLDVADSKPVKKSKVKKKKKLRRTKKSTELSSSGDSAISRDSAIICQPLPLRTDPVQAVTDFSKATKSPTENTPVAKEKKSKKISITSIPKSVDQNSSIELTQNNEKIHDLENEIKHLTEDKLSAAQQIEDLEARLAISHKKNQHRKGIIKGKNKLLETQESQHQQEIKKLNLQVQSAQAKLKEQQRKSKSTDEIVNQLQQENSSLTISAQDMSKSTQQQVEALQIKLEAYKRLIETTKNSLKLAQEELVKSRSDFYSHQIVSQQSLVEKDQEIYSLRMQLAQQVGEYQQNSLALIYTMGLERQAAVTKAIEAIIEQKIGQNKVSGEQGVTPAKEQKQDYPETPATHTGKWSPSFNFSVEGSSTTAPAPAAMGKSQSPSLGFESCG